jgi:mRNA-degrading endonuclease RelE of RelBE toxin-antitoxin system
MDVTLVDIIGVKRDWETHHRVRALAIDGGSDAIKGMRDLQKRHKDDCGKLLRVLRAVASNDRVLNPHHVKQGKTYKDVYEIRAGHARLFFFYTPDAKEVVVCTNHYWKAKDSEQEQDAQFRRCETLRLLYLESIGSKL